MHVRFGERRWETDSHKRARRSSPTLPYIRLVHGFIYLVVVMDWYGRYILSWEVSITLEKDLLLVEALRQALLISKPEISNTDQGPQFTSEAFTGILSEAGIRISMDGRGRVYDNIFVERLWRTVKYECKCQILFN